MKSTISLRSPIVFLLFNCFTPLLFADTPRSDADIAATARSVKIEEEIVKQRTALSSRMNELSETNNATEHVENASEDELDRMRTLDSLLGLRLATYQRRVELDAETKLARELLDRLRAFGPDEAKPYSFLLQDDIRDQLNAEIARAEATASDRRGAEQMLEGARDEFDQHEQERRHAQEVLDENDDETKAAELARELRLAELQSSISRETVALRRMEIEAKSARLEKCEVEQSLLKEKLELIAKNVAFTNRDLQARLTELTGYALDLKRRIRDAESQLHRLDLEQSAEISRLADSVDERVIRNEILEAFRLARRTSHEEIMVTNQRLTELDRIKHFWECRFDVINGKATNSEMKDWQSDVEDFLEQLQQAEHSLDLRLDEIRLDQATLFRRAHELTESSRDLVRWNEFRAEQLRRLSTVCESGVIQLKAAQRSAHRLVEDIESRLEPEAKHDYVGPAVEWATTIWNYEIASVDDRPITIGKISLLIVYLTIGIIAARLISRIAARRVLPRFGLNEGAVHAIHSILFYSLTVMFALLSLEVVHLPFAAFTFLGGAAAIGIGFGSQNILNNFISGLILLAEQPIRVGDLVEIDQTQGTVEHIGPRSTRVRTASNHEIIVPNSKLLENKVVNLTLSDNLVQTSIGVSMAPTIPLEEARRSLRFCATSHPKVLDTPEPIVLLKEFSSTSMVFELHFSLRMNSVMEGRVVESEVRETICDVFRNAGPKTVPSLESADAAIARRRLAG